ncbi:hypothetical protein ACS0TY_001501 [Phlomoides rotata]
MAKKNEIKALIKKWNVDMCCIQEIKTDNINVRMAKRLWGQGKFDWAFKPAEGNSGGLLTMWNMEKFQRSSVWELGN